ncbi:hypothetical protein INT45_005844 [Circinella minor]|uniref:Uncharacterized protein n=1 Tax=Circinella minor TaxID=1195481 RepID=A0A8H7S0T3_9FUNG|nr:hypothetical protein INT45_005844 [Circinella minor]
MKSTQLIDNDVLDDGERRSSSTNVDGKITLPGTEMESCIIEVSEGCRDGGIYVFQQEKELQMPVEPATAKTDCKLIQSAEIVTNYMESNDDDTSSDTSQVHGTPTKKQKTNKRSTVDFSQRDQPDVVQ